MSDRLAVDSNAVITWLRSGTTEPATLNATASVVLPLPVVGELYVGVFSSTQSAVHRKTVEDFIADQEILKPDEYTARLYGQIRAKQRLTNIRASKMNDLWIAALCLQHSLPLLTNDRGFDSIEGLAVVHW